jgi:23S rRNA (uracil1939-C5)-methyltransferase
MSEVELLIESVGVRGDGVAQYQGKLVYVPFSAPGDRLMAKLAEDRGEIVELLSPGARAKPACRHFGDCGGCALQHLSDDAYAAAKMSWLMGALASHGFRDIAIAPLARFAPGARRRARFALKRGKDGASAGFHARMSRRVVDMAECPILHPDLFALAAPLRALAVEILPPGGEGEASATCADSGVAVLLDLPATPEMAALETLARFAEKQDLARLSWRRKDIIAPVAQRRPARVNLAGVAIDLPEDAFLQASAEADRVLAEAVLAAAGAVRRVADLYAGLGAFSFALAKHSAVFAAEGDEESVKALRAAAARAGLAKVSAERRDLARRPLSPEELSRFDCVVFDPPYAGAAAQCRALASSKVPVAVAVSCNSATFARDARILADGGYALDSVRPFDTFIWSANLEIVARFSRR